MRKQAQKTLLLAVVFIVVATGFVLSLFLQKSGKEDATSQKDFIPAFDVAAVTTVEITQAGATTILEKQEEGWVVASSENAPAEVGAVTELLSVVDEAQIQSIVSKEGGAKEQYGFIEESQFHIVLKAEQQVVADVYVGSRGTLANTWYGLRAQDTAIYVVSGTYAALTRTDWKKKEEAAQPAP